MYIINYVSGAVRWTEELKLSDNVNLLRVGVVITLIDVKNKKALLFNKEENAIGWVDIPKQETLDDKDLETLQDFSKEDVEE